MTLLNKPKRAMYMRLLLNKTKCDSSLQHSCRSKIYYKLLNTYISNNFIYKPMDNDDPF